ncbi:PLAT domain-containing protein 3-like [Malania oleifera]|uniref:PLAT domain-containing protein 3-like n=1 Tax=Malania oleifera TaxID=397392 RepID=UPI0025ADCBC9|nr:PLAT domain-containing protein 3-like [Malania oleifera]
MKFSDLSLTLVIVFCFAAFSPSSGDDCVYTVYVRTGSIIKGGTDSVIGLTLFNGYDERVEVADLEAWGGLMGPSHDYFERGNLDIFSGRGRCLSGPFCAMNLTSDGSGPHHGWYCNYVEVTYTGAHIPCFQQLFKVEQWLARDAPPYQLNAFRDGCDWSGSSGGNGPNGREAHDHGPLRSAA